MREKIIEKDADGNTLVRRWKGRGQQGQYEIKLPDAGVAIRVLGDSGRIVVEDLTNYDSPVKSGPNPAVHLQLSAKGDVGTGVQVIRSEGGSYAIGENDDDLTFVTGKTIEVVTPRNGVDGDEYAKAHRAWYIGDADYPGSREEFEAARVE